VPETMATNMSAVQTWIFLKITHVISSTIWQESVESIVNHAITTGTV
jgi:hypothetical protein